MSDVPERKIRLLILDDHAVFREGLALLLGSEADLEVAAKCASVEKALQAVAKTPIDVVLLDLDLEGTKGSAFCVLAQELGYTGKILVLTGGVTDTEAIQLLSQGACGIFLKHSSPELLAPTIRRVYSGQTWVDPRLAPPPPVSPEAERVRKFTTREQQVLMAVLEGLANKEIAQHLDISENAVKSAMQQLFAKAGVRTRSQLVRFAMEYIGDRIR